MRTYRLFSKKGSAFTPKYGACMILEDFYISFDRNDPRPNLIFKTMVEICITINSVQQCYALSLIPTGIYRLFESS